MRFLAIFIFIIFAVVKIREYQCGDHDMKIVGGQAVDIKRFPYQVSLSYRDRHHCGGSIISKQWILTAAHCVHGRSRKYFKVRSGSTSHKKLGTLHRVTTIVAHLDYNTTSNDYDIALLRVKPRMKLGSETVDIIRLARREPVAGLESYVSGWGTIGVHGMLKQSPEELRAVKVMIVDRQKCRRAIRRYEVTERMICAGNYKGGKDACQGDSGGPLVARNKLVGVVSWGLGCGNPQFPGVYANIASLRKWIRNSSGV